MDTGPLTVTGLTKSYNIGDGKRAPIMVLEDISLELKWGEIAVLLGPTGCGKSSLLRILVGTESKDSGAIDWHGSDQKDVGVVWQHENCLPWLTVRSNIEFGLIASGAASQLDSKNVDRILDDLGLSREVNSYPTTLSGGQQQLVALARLLISQKRVWFLDEPFSALDARNRRLVQEVVLKMLRKKQIAVLLVTHDLVEALRVGTRLYLLTQSPASVSCIVDDVPLLRETQNLMPQGLDYLANIIGDRDPSTPPSTLTTFIKRKGTLASR